MNEDPVSCACPADEPARACAWCYDHASPGARRRWDDARERFIWHGRDLKLRVKGSAARSIASARAALQENARAEEARKAKPSFVLPYFDMRKEE